MSCLHACLQEIQTNITIIPNYVCVSLTAVIINLPTNSHFIQ